ncbi:MAG: hypothetical protein FWE23_07745 [Chitinivibrionia bacterium]|nr:hypothetical protein [Chitinivibrionia bacterium]
MLKSKITMLAVFFSIGICFADEIEPVIETEIITEIAPTVNERGGFREQFSAGHTILEIHYPNDFLEFLRLLFIERNTFAGKEIHLKNDLAFEPGTLPMHNITRVEFRGIFEGNGHSIKGLGQVPLFGIIRNAEIRNLNVSGQFIQTTVALRSRNSTLDNVNVSANVIGRSVGGLVFSASRTTIKNSSFDGNITASPGSSFPTGGLFSSAEQSTISNNSVSGTMSAHARAIRRDGIGMTTFSRVSDNEVNSEIIEQLSPFVGLEFGLAAGLGDYGVNTRAFNVFLGSAINRHFSIALGFGIHRVLSARTNGIFYDELSDETIFGIFDSLIMQGRFNEDILFNTTERLVPIYVRPILHIGRGLIVPVIDADIGIAIARSSEIGRYPSFYFSPAAGFEILNFGFSFGYRMWTAAYEKFTLRPNEDIFYTGREKRLNNAIFFKFAYSF